MAQPTTIAFSIRSFFAQGFDLETFEDAVRSEDLGVDVDTVSVGQITTQAEDEVVIAFADRPSAEKINSLYALVAAYVPPA